MESLGSPVVLVLILAGLGVVLLFAVKSMLKMTRTCLVMGVLGIFALFVAALAVVWALAR